MTITTAASADPTPLAQPPFRSTWHDAEITRLARECADLARQAATAELVGDARIFDQHNIGLASRLRRAQRMGYLDRTVAAMKRIMAAPSAG